MALTHQDVVKALIRVKEQTTLPDCSVREAVTRAIGMVDAARGSSSAELLERVVALATRELWAMEQALKEASR